MGQDLAGHGLVLVRELLLEVCVWVCVCVCTRVGVCVCACVWVCVMVLVRELLLEVCACAGQRDTEGKEGGRGGGTLRMQGKGERLGEEATAR